jgi:hypothetical protein
MSTAFRLQLDAALAEFVIVVSIADSALAR